MTHLNRSAFEDHLQPAPESLPNSASQSAQIVIEHQCTENGTRVLAICDNKVLEMLELKPNAISGNVASIESSLRRAAQKKLALA